MKKPAVDLTDLAIGIIILGIAVTIGVTILSNVRNNRTTELDVVRTQAETFTPSHAGTKLTNIWGKEVTSVTNATGTVIAAGNYTVTINDDFGTVSISNTTQNCAGCGTSWRANYTWYNTSRVDWDLPNDAMIGISEYGNWFKIIVIVGVAAVVLSLIFMAFGRGANKTSDIGGSY